MKIKLSKFYPLLIMILGFYQPNTFAQIDSLKSIRVYFKFDSSVLDPENTRMLDSVFTDGNYKIKSIEAYCDSIGNFIYNDSLSIRRAISVNNYLRTKDIYDSTIIVKTFGKRKLFNNNSTEAERSLNRCVIINYSILESLVSKNKNTADSGEEFPDTNQTEPETINNKPLKDNDFEKVEIGSTIVLNNLSFYPGRHVLLNSSKKILKDLYDILIQNPTLEIEIQGHVCCISYGDGQDWDTGTFNLSVNRAKTVYDYLISKGITKSRLTYRGFGSSTKISSETTEEGMQRNRRVEIKIIKK